MTNVKRIVVNPRFHLYLILEESQSIVFKHLLSLFLVVFNAAVPYDIIVVPKNLVGSVIFSMKRGKKFLEDFTKQNPLCFGAKLSSYN